MPFQSQSSGGLFAGQLSSTIARDDAVDEIEQALALLREARRDLLHQALVDLLRVLAFAVLEVEAVAPELVDVRCGAAPCRGSRRSPRPSSGASPLRRGVGTGVPWWMSMSTIACFTSSPRRSSGSIVRILPVGLALLVEDLRRVEAERAAAGGSCRPSCAARSSRRRTRAGSCGCRSCGLRPCFCAFSMLFVTHGCSMGSSSGMPMRSMSDLHAVAGEDAHEVVLEREVEAATSPGRPGDRRDRGAGCRCGATRGARCRRCGGRRPRGPRRPPSCRRLRTS